VSDRLAHSMAMAIVLPYMLMLISRVSSLSDPTIPRIFFPFGPDVGDSVVPVEDEGTSPGLRVPGAFPFFNASGNVVYVSHRRCAFRTSVTSELRQLGPTANVVDATIGYIPVFVVRVAIVLA